MDNLFSVPAKQRLTNKFNTINDKILQRFEYETEFNLQLNDSPNINITNYLSDSKDNLLQKLEAYNQGTQEESKVLEYIINENQQITYESMQSSTSQDSVRQDILSMAKQVTQKQTQQEKEESKQDSNVKELEDFLDDLI